jgi:hypothetical protein
MPVEDYGLKTAKSSRQADSKDRNDHSFNSSTASYIHAREKTVVVNTNPYVYIHNLGYVPKVEVWEILSDHNRKLPYDDGSNTKDFSITPNEVKIRGVTSGTFEITLFGQAIL